MQIGGSQSDVALENIQEASELGPEVQGQFVVRNSGPSLIPRLELIISWPSMSDSGEGFVIYPSRILLDSSDVSNVIMHLFTSYDRISYIIKTHDSESRGQEKVIIMHKTKNKQLLSVTYM